MIQFNYVNHIRYPILFYCSILLLGCRTNSTVLIENYSTHPIEIEFCHLVSFDSSDVINSFETYDNLDPSLISEKKGSQNSYVHPRDTPIGQPVLSPDKSSYYAIKNLTFDSSQLCINFQLQKKSNAIIFSDERSPFNKYGLSEYIGSIKIVKEGKTIIYAKGAGVRKLFERKIHWGIFPAIETFYIKID